MASGHENTGTFRNARFSECDASGMRLRDCDLRDVKATSCVLSGMRLSGEFDTLFVNDVDVTAYVAAELDRRFPERVMARELKTADDYRAMWQTIEGLWADTLARSEKLPEPARQERVDEEWSLAETLRHLVFATDLWVGRMLLDLPEPFHRLGLPPTDFPPQDVPALDLGARPSFAEVVDARRDRVALVRGVVARLTDAELDRTSTRELPAAWQEPKPSVAECLAVVINEEIEHRRYAERDLAVLLAR
jgi:uncharacterized damage-inducible protein DinB